MQLEEGLGTLDRFSNRQKDLLQAFWGLENSLVLSISDQGMRNLLLTASGLKFYQS